MTQTIAPKRAPKQRLPRELRASPFDHLDSPLALTLAGSFLLHFGVVVYLRVHDFPMSTEETPLPEFTRLVIKVEKTKKNEFPPEKTPQKPAAQTELGKTKPSSPAKTPTPPSPKLSLAEEFARRGLLSMIGHVGEGPLKDHLAGGGSSAGDGDQVFKDLHGVTNGAEDPKKSLQVSGTTGQVHGSRDMLIAPALSSVTSGQKTESIPSPSLRTGEPEDFDREVLDPAELAGKMRQYKGGLVACYEAAIKHAPSLAGKMTLRLTLNKMGRVVAAELEKDTIGDPQLGRCITERALTWRFNPPKEEVHFAYPLIFTPARQ